MAEINSFPNNSDEYIGAEEVMRWLHGRTKGVYAGEGNAAVFPVANSMNVTVAPGIGWITDSGGDGVCWWSDSTITLTIDAAESTGTLNRIDRIIVEWRTTDYADKPEVKVLKGTNASTASAPTLTNNSSIRQLSLARINIPAGTTTLTSLNIVDERMDETVCGIVTETVTADTTMIAAQYETALEMLLDAISQAWEGEISDGSVTEVKLAPTVKSELVADQINVKLTISANGSATKSIAGMTADHVLDSIQFYTDNDLTEPTGTTLADVTWTPGSGTLSITVANKIQNCYALLGFSYKPNLQTMTIS